MKAKSALQIIRNYEVAITNNGGSLVYKNTNGLEAAVEATFYLLKKRRRNTGFSLLLLPAPRVP